MSGMQWHRISRGKAAGAGHPQNLSDRLTTSAERILMINPGAPNGQTEMKEAAN
jgi:hypothetical protein